MSIPINIPERIWGRLASVADDRHTTVEELVTAGILHIIKPQSRQERILQLVRAGYSDARVAEATGELKNYVGQVRRQAGLLPNRPGKSKDAA